MLIIVAAVSANKHICGGLSNKYVDVSLKEVCTCIKMEVNAFHVIALSIKLNSNNVIYVKRVILDIQSMVVSIAATFLTEMVQKVR